MQGFNSTNVSWIWHITNQLSRPRVSAKRQIEKLDHAAQRVVDNNRDHFIAMLREIIRSSRSYKVRCRALQLLFDHAPWADVEWTIWLHRRRHFVHPEEYKLMCHLEDTQLLIERLQND